MAMDGTEIDPDFYWRSDGQAQGALFQGVAFLNYSQSFWSIFSLAKLWLAPNWHLELARAKMNTEIGWRQNLPPNCD